MSRATRIEFPGACYHVMSRGVGRRHTFKDDEDRRAFLDGVGAQVADGALTVHAFCLMPNHHHLLVETPRGELSRWMRYVNGDYARGFNRRHRGVGHLWQGRYKAILVEDGAYMLECARYIHLNPNRAKMTRPAERYRWSSYRNYVGGPTVVPWVETGSVLGWFGGDSERYRAHVEAGRGERPVSPFERAVAGLVLGSEAFVAKVVGMLEGRPASPDEPALAALRRAAKVAPDLVEAAVDENFATAGPARTRRLKMVALRIHSPLRPSEIARRYSRTPAAVTIAVRDIEAEAARRPELAEALAMLAERLGRPRRH